MKLLPLSGMEMSDVEHDADGLPKAWPIFRAGDNVVTRRNAMPLSLQLTGDDLRHIADYQRQKGAKIPIDCQHVVSNLAGKLGMDETDLLKQLPRYSGVAGFGNLEVRGDALYLADVEFLPIGAEVMRAGQFRYFSPSVRGLDGKSPLRVMSVALTNNPCLQNAADLAASEDDDDVTPEKVREALEHITPKEAIMPEENKAQEEAATAAAPAPEATPEKKEDKELLAVLKEVLGDDLTPENLKVTLATLKTKAESCTELAEKVKTLECAEARRAQGEEGAARQRVIDKGYARGVLTPAKLETPYIKSMTSMQLAEYCDSLPDGCAAPVKALELAEYTRPAAPAAHSTGNPVADAIKAAPMKDMRK